MGLLIVVLSACLGLEISRSDGLWSASRIGRLVMSGALLVALRLALVDRSVEPGDMPGSLPGPLPLTVALAILSLGIGYGLVAWLAARRDQ